MLLIALAVLCSVSVAVLLKLALRAGLDLGAMILWNYVAAGALCLLVLRPSLNPANVHPLALALGVLLPGLFLATGRAVGGAGIVRADIAQRLSLVLSSLAAFWLFHDRPTVWKLVGLSLGLVAMAGILARPRGARGSGGGVGWLAALWVGYAAVDVLLKQLAIEGANFPTTLQFSFAVALLCMLLAQMRRKDRAVARRVPDATAGLALGLLNFGNIDFYIRAHQTLAGSPAMVFATMNIGVVVLAALVGIGVFGERTTAGNRASIALACVAIVVLARASF